MKTMVQFIMFLILLLFLQNLLMDSPKSIPTEDNSAPKIDPSRIPHHFDWEQNRYIYMDEMPPPDTIKYKDIPTTAKPDSYVQVMGKDGAIRDDTFTPKVEPLIIIGGKKYRQQKLGNGDIKLIEVR